MDAGEIKKPARLYIKVRLCIGFNSEQDVRNGHRNTRISAGSKKCGCGEEVSFFLERLAGFNSGYMDLVPSILVRSYCSGSEIQLILNSPLEYTLLMRASFDALSKGDQLFKRRQVAGRHMRPRGFRKERAYLF